MGGWVTYLSSSSFSNFFGFLGQHSQMNMPCICDRLPFRECATLSVEVESFLLPPCVLSESVRWCRIKGELALTAVLVAL